MPTHRRAASIARTVRTVLDQEYADFELLIRSDGSDPATREVVAGIDDARIHYSETTTKLGIPSILNSLISDSHGEMVLPLHDHDLYRPTLLARMVTALDKYPSALFVHTGLEQIDREGRARVFVGDYPPITTGQTWLRHMLSRFDCPVCAMSMVRRETYEQYGLYDPAFGFVADVEMWMRLASHGDVAYVPEVLMSCPVRESTRVEWRDVHALLTMHRLYLRADLRPGLSRAFFPLRAEWFRLLNLVAMMRRTNRSGESLAEAASYFSESGGLVTRLLALGLPALAKRQA